VGQCEDSGSGHNAEPATNLNRIESHVYPLVLSMCTWPCIHVQVVMYPKTYKWLCIQVQDFQYVPDNLRPLITASATEVAAF
jgi:hypothetical protein